MINPVHLEEFVPTTRKTITLTEQQDRWVKARIASGDYSNDSEYFRDLPKLISPSLQGTPLIASAAHKLVATAMDSIPASRPLPTSPFLEEAQMISHRNSDTFC